MLWPKAAPNGMNSLGSLERKPLLKFYISIKKYICQSGLWELFMPLLSLEKAYSAPFTPLSAKRWGTTYNKGNT